MRIRQTALSFTRIVVAATTLLALHAAESLADTAKKAKTPPAATQAEPPADGAEQAPQGDGKQAIDDAQQYRHCIALAEQKPQEGWEEALAWTSLGGGEAARHCGAVALIGLKQYQEGASRLEDLARDSHRDARLRAGMLAQAGQAWLLAGLPEKAYADQTAALKLVPDAPDLLVDRAESLAAAKNYKEALADLDRAVTLSPSRIDALVFRATARRFMDDRDGARADIDRALQIDPNYADAWLESGILRRLGGDDNGARQDWMKVLQLAPDSPAGDDARRNLELLDVKTQ